MARAYDALSFEEEKHALLAKAHLVLAAKSRWNNVEETREALRTAEAKYRAEQKELFEQGANISDEVLADKDTMLVVLSAHGGFMLKCPKLIGDPDIHLAACQEDGNYFGQAPRSLRADRDFVLQAVKVSGVALEFASEALRGDREIVQAALQTKPTSLRCASKELRLERDLLLQAQRLQTRRDFLNYGDTVFEDSPVRSSTDKGLLLEVARVNAEVLSSASQELRQDKEFVLEVMRRVPVEDLELCYNQVDESLRDKISFEHFKGAIESGRQLESSSPS